MIENLLAEAGIQVNGPNPWDITVHNKDFFSRVLKDGALGLGESYIEEWWDCPQLDSFIDKVYRSRIDTKVKENKRLLLRLWVHKIFNFQTKHRAYDVGRKHYDLGDDLFMAMLDKRMTYTCGYWKKAKNLEQAQEAKLDLVCQKLGLKPGMTVLDIGCGWGAFLQYAAEKYGVKAVGITISKDQANLAKRNCRDLPVEIRFEDYRELNKSSEKFDRIVSLGMFEHVGHKNYKIYMKTMRHCLTDDGLFLLHTIGRNDTSYTTDEWIAKYVFPNGMLPSIKQIGQSIENVFVMEDWHNFGADYDKTLLAWHENFNKNWNSLKNNYDDTFFRLWNYYLLTCAGAFRARGNQLWQIVLSKEGVPGGYVSVR
ncbi:MAG TPA: cyclopropane fatty acyl phospholipid synthase [Gammaproteobacteria bacterium]|nr:cyclopropane fatty acyl phospholipid synthase [Gammaproteobacteria bacterium]